MPSISSIAVREFLSNCCPNKNQVVSLTALVIAVTGVALSIFAASPLGIIGFVLLGASTFLFYSMNNRELQQIETRIAQETDKNTARLLHLTNEMSIEIGRLQKNRQALQVQISALEDDNIKRQLFQEKLKIDALQMKEKMKKISQINTFLEDVPEEI